MAIFQKLIANRKISFLPFSCTFSNQKWVSFRIFCSILPALYLVFSARSMTKRICLHLPYNVVCSCSCCYVKICGFPIKLCTLSVIFPFSRCRVEKTDRPSSGQIMTFTLDNKNKMNKILPQMFVTEILCSLFECLFPFSRLVFRLFFFTFSTVQIFQK